MDLVSDYGFHFDKVDQELDTDAVAADERPKAPCCISGKIMSSNHSNRGEYSGGDWAVGRELRDLSAAWLWETSLQIGTLLILHSSVSREMNCNVRAMGRAGGKGAMVRLNRAWVGLEPCGMSRRPRKGKGFMHECYLGWRELDGRELDKRAYERATGELQRLMVRLQARRGEGCSPDRGPSGGGALAVRDLRA